MNVNETIIIHGYPASPFGQKIRRVMGLKGLTWYDVEVPFMMPKPTLTPLTGGYRRVPVMQIGADIYCDTSLIALKLEQMHPEPPLIPRHLAGLVKLISDYGDHRTFMWSVLPTFVAVIPELPETFMDDRRDMSPGLTKEGVASAAPHARAQLTCLLDFLEEGLMETSYLLGDGPTLADLSCFHPLWFTQGNPEVFALVMSRPRVAAWFQTLNDIGEGHKSAMSADEALHMARDSAPCDPNIGSEFGSDFVLGKQTTVVADDYGREAVTGPLIGITSDRIIVRHSHPAVGDVAVHFPRLGYVISQT